MLFLKQSVREELLKLAHERLAGKIGDDELGNRILKLDPESASASVALGRARMDAGDLDEAESLFWQGLARAPFLYSFYLAIADVRRKRDPNDVLSIRVRELGFWKLALAEEIPDEVAAAFRGDSNKLDFEDPETYEMLVTAYEVQHKDLVETAEVSERLLPYRLLNELQRDAFYEAERNLLRRILDEGAECLPLFRSGLREWARNPASVETEVIALIIALQGEIAGLEVLDDLLELAVFNDTVIVLHTHWAIWRIGQRYPQEVLAKLRAVSASASLAKRCSLAEQIHLLPEVPGIAPALLDLLRGFSRFADEPDAVHLLMVVLYTLIELHREQESFQALERFRPVLSKRGRKALDAWLEKDPVKEFVPRLVSHDIDQLTIDDVCIGRLLMMDEDDEDSDDEDSEEEHWDDIEWDEDPDDFEEIEPVKATVKPGRNDPCWCGSGKKYKKCHLAADEEAERSRR